MNNLKIDDKIKISEYLTEDINTFDQLCINYTNERLQHFFVTMMLSKEKQWYADQSLDVPFVPFFDNAAIIGIFIIPPTKNVTI